MDAAPHPPHLDRAWADPLILTLALLAFLLGSATLRQRAAPRAPAVRASLAARFQEIQLLGPPLLSRGSAPRPVVWEDLAAQGAPPWDRLVLAVHASEAGRTELLQALGPGLPSEALPVLAGAYQHAPLPAEADLRRVQRGLEGTAAGLLLEARWREAQGQSGQTLRTQVPPLILRRLVGLGIAALAFTLLGLGGLGFLAYLAWSREAPAGAAPWAPPFGGRALLLGLLGWFNLLLLSATLVHPLVERLPPAWRPLGLPLAYLAHASGGLWLWLRLSGLRLRELRRHLFPASWGRALAQALGFLGVAVVAAFTLSLLMAPLLKGRPHAQADLLDGFAATHPWPVTLGLFLTAAVLAPAWEELTFRGMLQPWVARRLRPWAGVALAALVFGGSHLLPTALPSLATLGLVLGLAFLRTRDLRTSILVHGAWNGSIFLAAHFILG